jgi:hypothetical protein
MALKTGTTYRMKDKQARNEAIKEYVKLHPGAKLEEMSAIYGLSVSRLWRIIHSTGSKA